MQTSGWLRKNVDAAKINRCRETGVGDCADIGVRKIGSGANDTFEARDPLSGQMRLVTLRKVTGHPLWVSVSTDMKWVTPHSRMKATNIHSTQPNFTSRRR